MLEKIAKESVDKVLEAGGKTVITMIDGFITDSEALHLRDFLWYARNKGVEVIFVSNKK